MSERSESMAERAIREAMERGDFDDLPGAGKPLRISREDDPDWFVKQLVEREQLDSIVLAPTVLGLRREATAFPESLADESDEETVRTILADYNLRVKRDRLRPALELPIPVIAPLVDIEEMVVRWRELRDARLRAAMDAKGDDGRRTPARRRRPNGWFQWLRWLRRPR